MKFGSQLEKLTMPWVWARSRMVRQYRDVESGSSEELRAWLKGSTKTMLDPAERKLEEVGCTIRKGVDIEELVCEPDGGRMRGVKLKDEDEEAFDRVLFTAPSYALPPMLPNTEGPYFDTIKNHKYFGVVCVVMALKENLTPSFWTYVNDKDVPFVGVINYSPFMDYEGHEGHHIIYIPAYCQTDEAPYTTDDAEILRSYKDGLKAMWPQFEDDWVKEERIFRVPNASLIISGEYSKTLLPLKTPIEDFWFANLSQIYPQDRGISISMKLAQYAVEAIEKNEDIPMKYEPY
jgi:protoporphyrinogen oxidase